MTSLESIVAEIEFFRGLSPEHVQALGACAREVQFAAGTVLGRAGEPADHFWAVRDGTLAVELRVHGRGAVTIETAKAGEVVGFSWLLPPHQLHFDVRALTPARALSFDGVRLRERCTANPAFGHELLSRFTRVMANRIHAMSLQLVDVYGDHPIESE